MDIIQSTSPSSEMQEILQFFHNHKKALLRELEKSGVLQRRRKVKHYSILLHAANLYLVHHLSLRRLSYRMALTYGVRMSDVAWNKQLVRFAPVLLAAARILLKRRMKSPGTMLAIDATNFSMEGKKGDWFRIHTSIFLLPLSADQLLLTDQHTAESVKNFHILPGCCYLADRAYGKTSQMAMMMERGADFVVRIPLSNVRLFMDPACKEKIDWNSWLSRFPGTKFSMWCFFLYQKKVYRIRLSGYPLSPEQQKSSRKRARRASQKKMNTVREKTLAFADWMVLATSLPDERLDLYEIYQQRWQIELFFKTGKSLLNFHRIRRCSTQWAQSLIDIWMASVIFFSTLYQAILTRIPSLSFFYCFDLLLSCWA